MWSDKDILIELLHALPELNTIESIDLSRLLPSILYARKRRRLMNILMAYNKKPRQARIIPPCMSRSSSPSPVNVLVQMLNRDVCKQLIPNLADEIYFDSRGLRFRCEQRLDAYIETFANATTDPEEHQHRYGLDNISVHVYIDGVCHSSHSNFANWWLEHITYT